MIMEKDAFRIDKEDARQYLQMLQDTINRMASKSSNCKTWTIMLFTAIAGLFIGTEEMRKRLWIISIPIVLLYYLDAYYLGLEKGFRDLERSFVNRLRSGQTYSSLIYVFDISKMGNYSQWKNFKKGLMSNATWPLYLMLMVICIALCIVL